MNYNTIFRLSDNVTLNLEGTEIRWCIISAVKFTDYGCKVDLTLPKGTKLYDISTDLISKTGSNIDTTEIQ